MIRVENPMGEYLLVDPEVVETSHGPALQGEYAYVPKSGPAQHSRGFTGLFYVNESLLIERA